MASFRIDWDSINLEQIIIKDGRSVLSLSRELGISDASIHKRMKKMGLK